MLLYGIGLEASRELTTMDTALGKNDNKFEVAAMLLRHCSDEWIAHALFDAEEFVQGRVYYVDEDVV